MGRSVDLGAVRGEGDGDGGVRHGARLLAFTEAAMGSGDAALERKRRCLREVLSDDEFVDACAVIGSFNVVDRIADATGIPLDERMRETSASIREQLRLGEFGSSANTPGA